MFAPCLILVLVHVGCGWDQLSTKPFQMIFPFIPFSAITDLTNDMNNINGTNRSIAALNQWIDKNWVVPVVSTIAPKPVSVNGTTIGLPVGTSVGTTLGTTLGTSVGTTVTTPKPMNGSANGTTIGLINGTIGVTVGGTIGLINGTVGTTVGTTMGTTMGTTIGTTMGTTVGTTTGLINGTIGTTTGLLNGTTVVTTIGSTTTPKPINGSTTIGSTTPVSNSYGRLIEKEFARNLSIAYLKHRAIVKFYIRVLMRSTLIFRYFNMDNVATVGELFWRADYMCYNLFECTEKNFYSELGKAFANTTAYKNVTSDLQLLTDPLHKFPTIGTKLDWRFTTQ